MPARREVLAAIGAAGAAVAGVDGAAGRRQSATSFATDFEFPAGQLGERGWTVPHGSFRTDDSYLVADGGAGNLDYQLSRPQERAAGRFRFRGIQNREPYYGLRFQFVSDRPTFGEPPVAGSDQRGYQLVVRNRSNSGAVQLVRTDGNGSESLVELTDDHDGRQMDVTVERDPDSWRFDCYLDGEHVGSAVDDTYTDSSYWVQKHGAGDSQRVDGLAVRPPGGGGQLEPAATAGGPATRSSAAGGTAPPSVDWLEGWYAPLAWLVGVPLVGPAVLGALVAFQERYEDDDG
jgi:hypothetical protein